MSTDSVGIVLTRSLQSRNRVVILDRLYGKKVGVTSRDMFVIGSAIAYHITPFRSPYARLLYVELQAVPVSLMVNDLGFLHLLLEMVHRIVPWNFRALEVYQLLLRLLSDIKIEALSLAARLVVLLKMCILLGFYPNVDVSTKLRIHRLVHMSLEDVFTLVLDRKIRAILLLWLRECITVEMGLYNLKTLGYLPTEKIQ